MSGTWRSTAEFGRCTPFQRAIYELTCAIPAGRVATYGTLAALLGIKGAQAVGNALHHNPFAPEVPCHRVVKTGATIGGFCGASEGSGSFQISRKFAMLAKEGVLFGARTRKLSDAGMIMTASDFTAAAIAAAQAHRGAGAAATARPVAPSHEKVSATTAVGSKRRRGGSSQASVTSKFFSPPSSADASVPAASNSASSTGSDGTARPKRARVAE
jgi:methylated-DNA-[protein]-cysteine S-methyltransferase